jgi:hypothetical protein
MHPCTALLLLLLLLLLILPSGKCMSVGCAGAALQVPLLRWRRLHTQLSLPCWGKSGEDSDMAAHGGKRSIVNEKPWCARVRAELRRCYTPLPTATGTCIVREGGRSELQNFPNFHVKRMIHAMKLMHKCSSCSSLEVVAAALVAGQRGPAWIAPQLTCSPSSLCVLS